MEIELERGELVTLLDHAMGLLPPETRGLLVQHYVEELLQAELTATCHRPIGDEAQTLARVPRSYAPGLWKKITDWVHRSL